MKTIVLPLAFALFIAVPCHGDLISHYLADGDATDSAGANDGTLNNGAGFATGQIGQAFDFDGINQFVQVSDDPSLDISPNISVAAWVRPESMGASDATTGIVWKGDSIGSAAGQSYALLWTDLGVFFRLGEGSTVFQTPVVAVSLNTFSHIAGTFDGSQMNLYVDGSLAAFHTTVPTSINNSSGDLLIGASATSGGGFGGDPTRFFFDGQIDDVRIYDHALSQAEVAALAVPEPSAFLLSSLFALVFGIHRCRRRK
jgi:hypothetical protein